MRCVLAVDGGNTKTLALVAALDGTILSVARGGCSDIYNAEAGEDALDPAAAALANAEHTVLDALRAASVAPADLAVSIFNMAGADWPEDLAFWHDAITERGYGRQVIAQNDALGVLYAASPDATGVSVVCGTGAATGARSAGGRVWHSSFWQDEVHGSAHLSQKLLFAVYRSALGIEPATSLTPRVLDFFGVETVEDVLHLFHNRLHPAPADVDRLTPILLDEADAGDALALRVVREHGAALGSIAIAAARKVGLEGTAFALVLAGGVFRHPTTVLEDAIVARVREASPLVRPMRSQSEPVLGVLIQALTVAGTVVDQSLVARAMETLAAAVESSIAV
ncbi:MAG TPA: BadF/BadG/BcrA/BcrD ATPase family protein [Ktedonobacterales bacterium]|nr:BadF/BadG/BcrA/BcrD ATPase family protein [Ktedonobacterales bacterium]